LLKKQKLPLIFLSGEINLLKKQKLTLIFLSGEINLLKKQKLPLDRFVLEELVLPLYANTNPLLLFFDFSFF